MPKPTSCHCKLDWDYRCGCFPPSTHAAKAYCSKFYRELFWHKKADVQDNWARCPVRVPKSVQFVQDTLCNQTWQEQAKLLKYMGLSEGDIEEATQMIREEKEPEDFNGFGLVPYTPGFPKRTFQYECRTCGEYGWKEDIFDGSHGGLGTCGACDESRQ